MSNRVVHTRFYTAAACDLMQNFFEYVDKCNVRSLYRFKRHFEKLVASQDPDGEVVVKYTGSWCGNRNIMRTKQTDPEFMDHFFWVLKSAIKMIGYEWNRNTATDAEFIDNKNKKTYKFSIRDVYFLYEYSKNHKNLENTYKDFAELTAKYIGQPVDPITAEMERTRREELKKIDDEERNAYNTFYIGNHSSSWIKYENMTVYDRKIRDFIETVRKEAEADKAKVKADFEKRRAAINETCSFMTAFTNI